MKTAVVKNKKTNKIYTVLHWSVLDVTGNGEINKVIYTDHRQVYARELYEFNAKFTRVN